MPEFFDPPSEEIDIILVDREADRLAVLFVVTCEGCCPIDAEVPFDLDSGESDWTRRLLHRLRARGAGEVARIAVRTFW